MAEEIAGRRRFRRSKRKGYEFCLALAFILPSFILYALFILLPLLQSVQLSFFDWNGISDKMNFVGISNYLGIWLEPRFLWSLVRTVIWWGFHVLLAVGAGLVVSLLVAQVKWGKSIFRTLSFLPHVLSLSVVGLIWSQMYHPTIGLVNQFLKSIGLGALSRAWLGDPLLALPSISVASAWQAYGFYMVIFLAGLQTINPQLYEAAMVDGANRWQQFWHITLPSLRNTITLVLSLALIASLKGFGTVWAMTGGGPVNSTELVAVYIWREAFQNGEIGPASAASLILGAAVIAFTALFNHWRDKEG